MFTGLTILGTALKKNKLPFELVKPHLIGRILSNYSPYLNINYCFTGRALKMVVSKTKHSKAKTEARSTQITKTKHPRLENEAPKTRKRTTQVSKTKHPRLENGAPKSRKRSTQKSKTDHPSLENKAPKTRKRSTQTSKAKHPKLENCLSFKNTRQSLVKSPAAGIKHDNE